MPNWCANTVTFSHEDPAQIDRLVKAFNGEGLFKEFIPVPKELQETTAPNDKNADELIEKYGYPDWYSFQATEWGTKWDVSSEEEVTADGNSVDIFFDSAWSPPIAFYEKMTEMGFTIDAAYYEPGMAFCGMWTSEGGDDCYDIAGDSAWVKENIPEQLDDAFAISENMEIWEEEEKSDV